MYFMDERNYQSDPCDRRLLCCTNCLLVFSCVCKLVACLTGQCEDAASVIDCFANVLYCCVQACMTTQVWNECKLVEQDMQYQSGRPVQQKMY
jgi:hypothetical protein